MKRSPFRTACLAAALMRFLCGAGAAGAEESPPRVDDIMARVVARARAIQRDDPSLKYGYVQSVVVQKLADDNVTVKERTERTLEAIRIEGRRYLRLIAKNGQALSADDQRKERERETKFRSTVASGAKESAEDDVELNDELVRRFTFTLVGTETINGRPAFVVTFEPKSRSLPARRRLERLLNKLAGKVWIDTEEYELAKVDAALVEEVGFGWGILANFERYTLYVEQTRLDDGTWMAVTVRQSVIGRRLFTRLRFRQQSTMTGFKKIA